MVNKVLRIFPSALISFPRYLYLILGKGKGRFIVYQEVQNNNKSEYPKE